MIIQRYYVKGLFFNRSSHRAGDEPDRGAGEPDSAGVCAVADKSGELKSNQINSSEIK